MRHLYPAIDLLDHQVVRLIKGDYNQKTVYSDKPEEFAKAWESQGAEWIHIVDLNGAKTGEMHNFDSLMKIRRNIRCKIQCGGGVRKLQDVERLLKSGINRVILGTKALDKSFFKSLMAEFRRYIAVGMDTREGKVQTQGWLENSSLDIISAIDLFNDAGVEMLIYTDIKRDGMLQGPDFEGLQKVLALSKSRVILSGGVSSLNDLRQCLEIKADNFEGCIIGKALYENVFTLKESLALMRRSDSNA